MYRGRRQVFSSSGDRSRAVRLRQLKRRSRVRKFVVAAFGNLFAAVFPSECRLCQRPLASFSRIPVCDECLDRIAPLRGARCPVCGDSLPLTPLSQAVPGLCAACRMERPLFERVASYGSYTAELRDLIHLLKYGHVRTAAGVLGQMLAEAAESLLTAEPETMVMLPIPLHASRFRERGFNQAELLAQVAERELHRKGYRVELDTTLLLRRRATESQTGLSREQRRENIRGAFMVAAPENLENRTVLLVDDVMTTGATIAECARVLLNAGARSVLAATVARSSKQSSLLASYREGTVLGDGVLDEVDALGAVRRTAEL